MVSLPLWSIAQSCWSFFELLHCFKVWGLFIENFFFNVPEITLVLKINLVTEMLLQKCDFYSRIKLSRNFAAPSITDLLVTGSTISFCEGYQASLNISFLWQKNCNLFIDILSLHSLTLKHSQRYWRKSITL